MSTRSVDVLIIGGGPAGLSAALTLSRTRRRVALFDSGLYRNSSTRVMNNVPGADGTNPHEFRSRLRNELVSRYSDTFQYIPRKVQSLRKAELFHLNDGQDSWTGRKVILATGIKDRLPSIPGFDSSVWGRSVIHCIYCHGTETHHRPIAVLLNPADGQGMPAKALLNFMQKFDNLQHESVTVLANGLFGEGASEPRPLPEEGITAEILALAKKRGYQWNLKRISSISSEDDNSHAPPATIHFVDNTSLTTPFVVYSPYTEVPQTTLELLSDPSLSAVKESLNKPSPMTTVPMGEITTTSMFQKADVDGVYACGNATLFMATVVMSMNQGQMAGAGADHEIAMEDYAAAIAAVTASL